MVKGQAEILGIALIVVLLILGFLFVLRFSSSGDTAVLKERLVRMKIANNVLSTLLKTSDINCNPTKKTKIEELFVDCSENHEQRGSLVCQGKLSCDYVAPLVKTILERTIRAWNFGYEFTIKQEDKLLFSPVTSAPQKKEGKCPLTRESDTVTYPLPTTNGIIEVTLKVCI